jgi:hypothetical protein
VDPPLRVREDWWVFEDLLRFKGGLVGFRKTLKVQGSTGGFSKKATSKQPLSKSLSEGGFIPAQKTAALLLA